MAIIGKHGITSTTPENILLGAGTYHRNLKFEGGKWTGDILGATNGGGKIAITGEFVDIEVDGALVKVKGMAVKQGGTVTVEANFAELSIPVMQIPGFWCSQPSRIPNFSPIFKTRSHIVPYAESCMSQQVTIKWFFFFHGGQWCKI